MRSGHTAWVGAVGTFLRATPKYPVIIQLGRDGDSGLQLSQIIAAKTNSVNPQTGFVTSRLLRAFLHRLPLPPSRKKHRHLVLIDTVSIAELTKHFSLFLSSEEIIGNYY
jgi:hypothetical protein